VHGSSRLSGVQDAVLDGTALAVEVVVGLYLLLFPASSFSSRSLMFFQLHTQTVT
jgi:hypothetical protein